MKLEKKSTDAPPPPPPNQIADITPPTNLISDIQVPPFHPPPPHYHVQYRALPQGNN